MRRIANVARGSIPVTIAALAGVLLVAPGLASAVTIGSVTRPAGSSELACGTSPVGQAGSVPSIPYAVPAGGGLLTSWQINTHFATEGATVTLVVFRHIGSAYQVVRTDTETLPTPLPAGEVASFNIALPIAVQAGDVLGLYAPGPAAMCASFNGSIPSGNHSLVLEQAPPTPGRNFGVVEVLPQPSQTNVAATLVDEQDVSVTTTVIPSTASVGAAAVLTSTVGNAGPVAGAITFTDSIPAGLSIQSAVAGPGSCNVSGQTVTCTVINIAAGQNAPAVITVIPRAPGSYVNQVSVAPEAGETDPNLANNSASATLTVGAAQVTTNCQVPKLTGLSLAIAEKLLGLLSCKVGKVAKAHSKKIAKGAVIKTTPAAGTFAPGTAVALTVSSGRAKHRGRNHRRH